MFDRIVVVDWSANSAPKLGRDSIWIGVNERGSVSSSNVATRHAAAHVINEILDRPGRTLLGVDFSLGYPHGTASALGLEGVPWRAMWNLLATAVTDDDRNRNNRFVVASDMNRAMSGSSGPFWGCPPAQRCPTLSATKGSSSPLAEWRVVESTLRERGHRPFSSWQLLGAGSVGSQSLLGIPVLEALVRSRDDVDVWPFTSGLQAPGGRVVVAEVWPSLVTVPAGDRRVRDEAQVETLATELAENDLTGWFTPELSDPTRRAVEREEGWVLGA